MNSIRRGLTLLLLAGFALLLGAGGLGMFHFMRSALKDQFDEALAGKAVAIAALIKMENERVEFEFSDHVAENAGHTRALAYCQLSQIGGKVLYRSPSLNGQDLSAELGSSAAPRFSDIVLDGGIPVRAVGIIFSPAQEAVGDNVSEGSHPAKTKEDLEEEAERREHGVAETRRLGLIVAEDQSDLKRQITSIGYIILATTGLTLLASLVMVDLALWHGLAKLKNLTDQASHIGVGTLGKRFPVEGMPQELSPICEALNGLLERLEETFVEINEYAGKVAHEMRTPLTVLRLKIEAAGSNIPPQLAEDLQAELQQLTHVVDQSLLIARAEQGRLKAERRVFDLANLVADVAEDFSLISEQENRKVRFSRPATAAEVCVDPKHTRQIIYNLLSNAWRHGAGDITLRVRRTGGHRYALTILNAIQPRNQAGGDTLGLGLRVVDTLLRVESQLKYRRHHGEKLYAVSLLCGDAARIQDAGL